MAESQKLYPVFEIPAMQASMIRRNRFFFPPLFLILIPEILSETVRTASSW